MCEGSNASGPDDYTLKMLQQGWEIVKDDLLKVFEEFYDKGIVNAITNETYICLIPKKENAKKVREFCPISLTTSLYKILAKVLANRLKEVIALTVDEHQSAFIEGR